MRHPILPSRLRSTRRMPFSTRRRSGLTGQPAQTVAARTAIYTVPFVMSYAPSHLALPASIDATDALFDTEAFWTDWSARSDCRGPNRDLYRSFRDELCAIPSCPPGFDRRDGCPFRHGGVLD